MAKSLTNEFQEAMDDNFNRFCELLAEKGVLMGSDGRTISQVTVQPFNDSATLEDCGLAAIVLAKENVKNIDRGMKGVLKDVMVHFDHVSFTVSSETSPQDITKIFKKTKHRAEFGQKFKLI